MQFLEKSDQSKILQAQWTYSKKGDVPKIRAELLNEQQGFCAYSEAYINEIDSPEVDHFDGNLKYTSEDGYWNWYAVKRWMNQHKSRSIKDFQPLLCPYAPDLKQRIKYESGEFLPINPSDEAAKNLIAYLLWNSPKLVNVRRKQVKRIRQIYSFYSDDREGFYQDLLSDPDNLSFFSALQAEFDLPEDLLNRLEPA
ncbi:MAG: hypothetical protein AAGG51_27385 [Cyanobacteria bacterium P01_G01_bin.54]